MQRLLILAAGLAALVLLTWFCAYPKVAFLADAEPEAEAPVPGPPMPSPPPPSASPSPPPAPAAVPPLAAEPEPAKAAVPPAAAPTAPSAAERVVGTINRIVGNRVIEFEIGSSTLAPSGSALLDELLAPIKSEPTARLRIEGHTDSSGDPQFNRDLSRARAEAVRAYLVGQGIDPSRIEARGYGADRPIADNATAEGRLRNRRVEFTAIE